MRQIIPNGDEGFRFDNSLLRLENEIDFSRLLRLDSKKVCLCRLPERLHDNIQSLFRKDPAQHFLCGLTRRLAAIRSHVNNGIRCQQGCSTTEHLLDHLFVTLRIVETSATRLRQ